MGKSVVVIASGETERRAIPHLAQLLGAEGVALVDVRIPPSGHLTVEMVEQLIKASWYSNIGATPTKFVVLVDADGKSPPDVLGRFQDEIPKRVRPKISAALQFAYAQHHLEAWYFADDDRLQEYLGRKLGNVDCSHPDEIRNPKLHLKHLLGDRAYTAVISEAIARQVRAETVIKRSPSFRHFIDALRNGDAPAENTTR